ncbi:queuosine biosynthesis ATPase [Microcystis phage Me-ZS1]|nr:queuosine biosynthesis ATPase [Microcystis phage Me-ZS1]
MLTQNILNALNPANAPSQGKTPAVLVFSGGQDSVTCLYLAKHFGFDVHAVTVNYGQRHAAELDSASKIAHLAGIPHEFINLGPVLKGTSPLVSTQKLEQYSDEYSLPGGLEKTFVPMRNQLFLTLAANRAYCAGTNILITGVCEEDFGGYPDCRRSFIDSFESTCTHGTFTGDNGVPLGLKVWTPLMKLSKAETVLLATMLPGCYAALAYSHTAYDGAYPPTGKDHATLLRSKGFLEAGIPDPLILRAAREELMALPCTPNYAPELVRCWTDYARGRWPVEAATTLPRAPVSP